MKKKRHLDRKIGVISLLFVIALVLNSCEALKTSRPIFPIKEYERIIVGRLDAEYVGTQNCLSACHYHDTIKRSLDASTMGLQLSRKSGLPLVNCESCHGPGSLAIEGITPEKVEEDAKKGIQTSCNYRTFIDIKNLPPEAQSLICLKCHTANATFNLHRLRYRYTTIRMLSTIPTMISAMERPTSYSLP